MKKDQDRSRQKKIEKNGLFFEIVKDRKRGIQIERNRYSLVQRQVKMNKRQRDRQIKIDRQVGKDRPKEMNLDRPRQINKEIPRQVKIDKVS